MCREEAVLLPRLFFLCCCFVAAEEDDDGRHGRGLEAAHGVEDLGDGRVLALEAAEVVREAGDTDAVQASRESVVGDRHAETWQHSRNMVHPARDSEYTHVTRDGSEKRTSSAR